MSDDEHDTLGIPGCHLLTARVHEDSRGRFVKPFTASAFNSAQMRYDWAECFWSESRAGVVRGFHFQLPPAAHAKLVWVMSGVSHSVLLDLRAGSPMFGKHASVRLDSMGGRAIYVPEGVSHAFQALQDQTLLGYLVTSEHDPQLDTGVRWDSAGVAWPARVSEVSARDRLLPPFGDFATPFRYRG
jgi:dTDP-4-dehydrorhamnose 3,5-epimerase